MRPDIRSSTFPMISRDFMNTTFMNTILVAAAALVIAGCGPTLKQRKNESEIHYRMGVVHLRGANYTEALKELTTAVQVYPDDANYHNALGLAYFYKGMNSEAIKSIKEALKLNPDFSEAHIALSAAYMVEGRWDGVIEESKAALKNIFYKTPEVAYFNMGSAYFNKGGFKEALLNFSKAAEISPSYALAHYTLGLTYD